MTSRRGFISSLAVLAAGLLPAARPREGAPEVTVTSGDSALTAAVTASPARWRYPEEPLPIVDNTFKAVPAQHSDVLFSLSPGANVTGPLVVRGRPLL